MFFAAVFFLCICVRNVRWWIFSAVLQVAQKAARLQGGLGADAVEVHVGVIDRLQGVVVPFGLLQRGHRLLTQKRHHSGLEAEARFPLCFRHGVQADAAVGLFPIIHSRAGGDERQAQAGNQEMFYTGRVLRRGTDDGIPALFRRRGMELGQSRARQFPSVGKLIDPGTKGIHAVEAPDAALMCDTAEKAAGGTAFLVPLDPELPGDDALDAAVQTFPVEGFRHGGHRVQFYLTGGFQAVVSPDVGRFIGMGAGLDLGGGVFSGGEVVEAAQVYITVDCGGVLGLDDMGVSN